MKQSYNSKHPLGESSFHEALWKTLVEMTNLALQLYIMKRDQRTTNQIISTTFFLTQKYALQNHILIKLDHDSFIEIPYFTFKEINYWMATVSTGNKCSWKLHYSLSEVNLHTLIKIYFVFQTKRFSLKKIYFKKKSTSKNQRI